MRRNPIVEEVRRVREGEAAKQRLDVNAILRGNGVKDLGSRSRLVVVDTGFTGIASRGLPDDGSRQDNGPVPTVKDIAGPYRFYVYSLDCNEPAQVHVRRDRAVCKFWLDPPALAQNHGMSARESS